MSKPEHLSNFLIGVHVNILTQNATMFKVDNDIIVDNNYIKLMFYKNYQKSMIWSKQL